MIIAHSNFITRRYFNSIVKKKDIMYTEFRLGDVNGIKSIKSNIMYYDQVVAGIVSTYDYRVLMDAIKLEDEDLSIIFWFSSIDDYNRAVSVFKKREIDFKELSIKTVKREIALICISLELKKTYFKEFSNKEINDIYQYLCHKNDIDGELSKIGSLKTKAGIKRYIAPYYQITPNNFSENLLLGRRKEKVSLFLLEYKNNMNYIITILENYVSDCLVVYELLNKEEDTTESLAVKASKDTRVSKRSTRDLSVMTEIINKYGFSNLYALRESIDNANTKLQKQIIIMRLI